LAVVRTEAGKVVGYTVAMERYWAAVVKQETWVICLGCLDDDMGRIRDRLLRGEAVEGYRRVYIDEQWQYYPQCCCCGAVLEYVTLLPLEGSYDQ
jgi:hypothetical protein